MTMLEKAARAAAFVFADHKHTSDQWWYSLIDTEQRGAIDVARAVLEAVLEPSDEQCESGSHATIDEMGNMSDIHGIGKHKAKAAYIAMIDHALNENQE